MKKISIFVLIVSLSLVFSGCSLSGQNNSQGGDVSPAIDDGQKAHVYFFWGDGCPHCEDQKPFLEEMKNKYPDLVVKEYETWKNKANAALFQEMATAFGTRASGVPTTFIGEGEPFVGFSESMEAGMEVRIKICVEQGCTDPGSKL